MVRGGPGGRRPRWVVLRSLPTHGSLHQPADPRIEGTASPTTALNAASQTLGHADRLVARSHPSPAGWRGLSCPGGHGDRRARPASNSLGARHGRRGRGGGAGRVCRGAGRGAAARGAARPCVWHPRARPGRGRAVRGGVAGVRAGRRDRAVADRPRGAGPRRRGAAHDGPCGPGRRPEERDGTEPRPLAPGGAAGHGRGPGHRRRTHPGVRLAVDLPDPGARRPRGRARMPHGAPRGAAAHRAAADGAASGRARARIRRHRGGAVPHRSPADQRLEHRAARGRARGERDAGGRARGDPDRRPGGHAWSGRRAPGRGRRGRARVPPDRLGRVDDPARGRAGHRHGARSHLPQRGAAPGPGRARVRPAPHGASPRDRARPADPRADRPARARHHPARHAAPGRRAHPRRADRPSAEARPGAAAQRKRRDARTRAAGWIMSSPMRATRSTRISSAHTTTSPSARTICS